MNTSGKIAEFRQRVEAEWHAADVAAAWQKHYRQMREQLRLVTLAFVDGANPRAGMSVLDLASGTGEPALTIAERVGPGGHVVATDLNEYMLQALSVNAAEAGVSNITTQVCDANELPFPNGTFDLVTSRFGVMFFADTLHALTEVRRVLKPTGSLACCVWDAPAPGTYFGAAAIPYLARLAVKPDPDGPGPMRFAEPGKLARLVQAAGFQHVAEKSLTLPAPFEGPPAGLLASMLEIAAPFRNAVATLAEEDRQAADAEALGNLQALYDGRFTRVTAPVRIVTASAQ